MKGRADGAQGERMANPLEGGSGGWCTGSGGWGRSFHFPLSRKKKKRERENVDDAPPSPGAKLC